MQVIVWLASFPRSGNTFFRILLKAQLGIRTSTVYEVDGVASRVGPDLIGFEERPASYEDMRASDAVHVVKTHRPRRPCDVSREDAAICLVRDGRDALVSWARQRCEREPSYEQQLRELIALHPSKGAGRWGHNVLSWLDEPLERQSVVHFDVLVTHPLAALDDAVGPILGLLPKTGTPVPTFGELRGLDPSFFRRGAFGSHRDEMPPDLEREFWAHDENVVAMELLQRLRPVPDQRS